MNLSCYGREVGKKTKQMKMQHSLRQRRKLDCEVKLSFIGLYFDLSTVHVTVEFGAREGGERPQSLQKLCSSLPQAQEFSLNIGAHQWVMYISTMSFVY
ncbi:hypothetical protein HAX54_021300 [Datura stramonium]|uniref:Uncharacterized protein n=1 Tax=Datura stramonium TaxID=4076 RepID=A0ABS8USG8_DATST|nr:hypothetical protein [Datura stramonium]